jgi:hypothetical protein
MKLKIIKNNTEGFSYSCNMTCLCFLHSGKGHGDGGGDGNGNTRGQGYGRGDCSSRGSVQGEIISSGTGEENREITSYLFL